MAFPIHLASKGQEMAKKEPSLTKNEDFNNEDRYNFDSVVKCMSENVVVEYLHDILSFLLSDRTELRFETAGYAELFHMNLFLSADNLYCKYFNKRCTSMSHQIIKVLNNKKDVYKCINFFENVGGKRVVVYKKEYVPKTQTTCCEGDSCCDTSNPQSITEHLHSECSNHNSHKVSQVFKARWLTITLKFIKDDSKLTHQYIDLSPMEATFVYSMITRCKEQTDMAANSYYTPLKEAMQIVGLKYFFELTYIDTYPNGKMSLMLEKFPKNIKSIIEGDKRGGTRFRNMKFIKQPKIRTSDENRAGRVVSRLKNQERFKADANRLGDMAPPEIDGNKTDGVAGNMENTAGNLKENVVVNMGTMTGNMASGLAASLMGDMAASGAGPPRPRPSRPSRRDRSSDPRTDKLIRDMSVPIKSDKAMRMMYGMGWDGGALGVRGDGITEPIIPSLDLKAGAGLGHGVRSRSPQREQKQRVHDNEQRNTDKKTNRQQAEEHKINTPPTKKESHPKYRLKTPPPPYIPKTPHRRHDRSDIFQMLLDVITSCDTVMQFEKDKRITNKEKGFILNAVRSANERVNVGVTDHAELKQWDTILDEMNSNQDLHIKVAISENYRMITLTKDDSPYMSKKKKRKLQKKPCILNIPALSEGNKKIITNDFLRNLTDTYIASYATAQVSTKAPTGITFRVAILIHLLDIAKSDRLETEIEFERILNDKEREYLENTFASINVRRKRGGSKLEQDILLEIKDHLEIHILRVEILSDRTFKVYKVDKKRTDKSSRDVSNPTCTTDEYVNNCLELSGSKDSDVGHDGTLGNNDNAGEFEHNDNNDVSEASKGTKLCHQIEKQELTVTKPCESIKENISQEKKSFDYNKNNKESIQNNDADKIEPNILETNIQNSVRGTTRDILKIDHIHSQKETSFDDTSHKLAQNLPNDTKDSRYRKATESQTDLNKSIVINSKSDKQKSGNNTEIDSGSNMQDLEDDKEKNVSKNNRRSSIFDVLQSYVENFNKNQEINALKCDKKHTEKTEELTSLQTDIENSKKGTECSAVLTGVNAERDLKNIEKVTMSDLKVDIIKSDISESAGAREKTEPQYPKTNKYMQRVYLVPNAYPMEEVDTEFAKNIQIMICKHIEVSTELPLLKCHGVLDGALIYSCHNENTLQWLQNVCATNGVKIIVPVNNEVRYKMSLKINSFIDYTSAKLFRMLQLYNDGLQIEPWVELSVEKSSDSLMFIVEIDEKSLKYIKESNFTLFAGIDQVQFNAVLN